MATILELHNKIVELQNKPVEQTTYVPLTEELKFFYVIKERLEFQKLQAMKDIGDAKYRIKSFSRQIKEVEKSIEKLKKGKKLKPIFIEKPKEEKKELIPITVAQEAMINSYKPERIINPPVMTETAKHTPSLFVKSNVFQNKPVSDIPDFTINNRRIWKCEKCNNDVTYPNKKMLKEHISQTHSY